MKRKPQLKFWIPFSGRNTEDLGTRIEFDPDQGTHAVAPFPETRPRGFKRISNSGKGLRQIFDALSLYVADIEDLQQVFFNVCWELLRGHQRSQRHIA